MAPANSWLGYYFDAPFQHSDKLVYLTRPQLSLKHHEQQILGPANDCLVSGFKSKAGWLPLVICADKLHPWRCMRFQRSHQPVGPFEHLESNRRCSPDIYNKLFWHDTTRRLVCSLGLIYFGVFNPCWTLQKLQTSANQYGASKQPAWISIHNSADVQWRQLISRPHQASEAHLTIPEPNKALVNWCLQNDLASARISYSALLVSWNIRWWTDFMYRYCSNSFLRQSFGSRAQKHYILKFTNGLMQVLCWLLCL